PAAAAPRAARGPARAGVASRRAHAPAPGAGVHATGARRTRGLRLAGQRARAGQPGRAAEHPERADGGRRRGAAGAARHAPRAGPAPDIVAELLEFYNDSSTTRMQGDVSFPAGSNFVGKLALYRGSLRLGGRVRGRIVVINATLYLLPGADVEGDVLVVGGRL